MNILKKFEVKDLNNRIRSHFNKGFSTEVERVAGFPDDPWNEVYEYKTTLCVRFTANNADYDMALENAKRQTQMHIYGDVLSQLQIIETCVYNGGYCDTLEEINRLRTIIMDIE